MTAPRRLLVTGATGNQGSGAVQHALAAGHIVYAFVRDVSAPKARVLEAQGAILLEGSYDDIPALTKAVSGVEAIFHFPPESSGDFSLDVQRSTNVVTAARSSPTVVQFILATTIKAGQHETFPGWGETHPMYQYWLTKHAIENLVREPGAFEYWTIIRPAHFLQNLLVPVRTFVFPGFDKSDDAPTLRTAWKPETRIPWIDVRDEGVVVAAAVSDPRGFHQRHIDLAAEALTPSQLAEKMSKVLGKPVRVHHYSETEENELAKTSRVIASERWANDVPAWEAAEAAKEFTLTSVEEFLRKEDRF